MGFIACKYNGEDAYAIKNGDGLYAILTISGLAYTYVSISDNALIRRDIDDSKNTLKDLTGNPKEINIRY